MSFDQFAMSTDQMASALALLRAINAELIAIVVLLSAHVVSTFAYRITSRK